MCQVAQQARTCSKSLQCKKDVRTAWVLTPFRSGTIARIKRGIKDGSQEAQQRRQARPITSKKEFLTMHRMAEERELLCKHVETRLIAQKNAEKKTHKLNLQEDPNSSSPKVVGMESSSGSYLIRLVCLSSYGVLRPYYGQVSKW